MHVLVKHQRDRAAPTGHPIERSPTNNSQKPGPSVTTPKTAEVPRSTIVGFLNDVLGGVVVLGQPTGQVVGGIQMGQYRLFKMSALLVVQVRRPFACRGVSLTVYSPPHSTALPSSLFPMTQSFFQRNS